MKEFRITTKDLTMVIQAPTRLKATQLWFQKIKNEVWRGKDTLEQLGHIATVHEKGEEDIAFRIAPAIFAMGLIDEEVVVKSLAGLLECSKIEASVFLVKALENDKKFITNWQEKR